MPQLLATSGFRLCLLINFQKPKVEWKRIIYGFETPERMEEPSVPGQTPVSSDPHYRV
jgi:hypothetical protein